jgi:hypothetical protein
MLRTGTGQDIERTVLDMAKVSISKAAKLAGVARSHLYEKYIKPGKMTVSTDDDGKRYVDTSELLRVFGTLKGLDSEDSHEDSIEDRSGHVQANVKDSYGQQLHDSFHLVLEEKDKHIRLLQAQLEEARQREIWLQEQVKTTTKLLEHKAAEATVGQNDASTEHRKGFFARLFKR